MCVKDRGVPVLRGRVRRAGPGPHQQQPGQPHQQHPLNHHRPKHTQQL